MVQMVKKVVISGGKLPATVGPFSPAVRLGDLLFLSGQAPIDERGELIGETIEEQTLHVFQNLKLVLGAAGATLDDLLSVTVYMNDMDEWPAMNEVFRQQFSGGNFPARTTVQSAMRYKGRPMKIEIQAVAHAKSA